MSAAVKNAADPTSVKVDFTTQADRYAHWRLSVDGEIATLAMHVNEDKGIQPGYRLKLNSYDLGVDIELADALNRIRFEHPAVKCVVITSARERMFCSGANIYMLGQASHAWKVNFCRFTNETRNGIEDSSRHEGLKFLAAVNGTVAGGGYELALACDEILMVDDRSSTVSLPEVPLLGVLPGTGGLTRLIDKRRVRRDLADVFCSTAEGVRADRARQWNLVDHIARPQQFADAVRERASALAAESTRPGGTTMGIELTPLERRVDEAGYRYRHVEVGFDRAARTATLTLHGPAQDCPTTLSAIHAQGANWWPLAMARELDDAILMLRTNEPTLGLWVLKTRGDAGRVLAVDAVLSRHRENWLVKETMGLLRRTLARLEVSPRSLFAIADPGSCFAGTLLELLLAADRSYMLAAEDGEAQAPAVSLSMLNFGAYPTVNGQTRLQTRFCGNGDAVEKVFNRSGVPLDARAAVELGLVTFAPDELDWADEVRLAIDERAGRSPDAVTGPKRNLRFPGEETMETRIFGRLSAWQNWIFNRPNAVGEHGALKVYGSGAKARFDWGRV